MDSWDEIKTAYQVARLGTVSGAAEVLGVHHATVIRHVDALEQRLGVKLFQRHARGYTPTEPGDDLFRVAQATDDQFSQLAGRIKGRGNEVSGELVVTTLTNMAPRIAGVLSDFQRDHPGVIVRYLTGERLFRLEYGEAHVAIRAGSAPEQPDNVVQPFVQMAVGLYASKDYVAQCGMPGEITPEITGHRFVCHDAEDTRAPYYRWLWDTVPREAVTFRSTDLRAIEQAVLVGAGIGFLPMVEARENPDLIEVMPSLPGWSAPLWLVTHVDLHRTSKVQAFLAYLKERAGAWEVV